MDWIEAITKIENKDEFALVMLEIVTFAIVLGIAVASGTTEKKLEEIKKEISEVNSSLEKIKDKLNVW